MKILFLILLGFNIASAAVSAEVFSKWNLNYADLLVDQGKYLEAVEAYNAAFEATDVDKLKIDAMIRQANVLSIYLDEKDMALSIYKKIYTKFPTQNEAEFALYQAGMLSYDMHKKDTKKIFDRYLKEYKNGKFYFQIKFLNAKLNNTKVIQPKYPATKKVFKPQQNITQIRVALHKKIKNFSLKGDLSINGKRYSEANFRYENNKILFNNRKYSELVITSATPFTLSSKKFKYTGSLRIIAKKGYMRVINVVDIENYIYGVVTSESFSRWKLEALKAQAIASRTYAYYQSTVRKNWDYDVLDNTGDQVYKGLNGKSKSGVKATDATRGLILTYKNKPILSQYTANSGWRSASSKEIFGVEKHYLYGHKDEFSKKMPDGHWKNEITLQEIEQGLLKRGIDIGKLYDVQASSIGESGRILKVKFIGSKGEKTLQTNNSLRRIAGLKDILTTIEKRGSTIYFVGGGFGHGVGYSQWGGQSMAKSGYKYDEILKFYYRDTELKKLFE